MLSDSTHFSHSKVSLFGVHVVSYPTSSAVFVSEYIIYFGSFNQNFSGYMFVFANSFIEEGGVDISLEY